MDFNIWQTLITTSPSLFVAVFALYSIIRWTEGQNKREKERDDVDREEAKRREEFWTQRTQSEKEFSERQVKFLEGRITALETKLAEKDQEISKLGAGIDALTTDLKEALDNMGQLEQEKKTVERERDDLRKTVGELSDRLKAVEEIQRKGTDNKLDAAKVKPTEDEDADKGDVEDIAA